MIELIKGHSLAVIRTKLIFLYILNVTDIVFTFILLNTGLFYEANVLISKSLNNGFIILMLKLGLPAILLSFIYLRISKASKRQLRISNIIVNIGLGIYLLVNFSHLFWLVTLFRPY